MVVSPQREQVESVFVEDGAEVIIEFQVAGFKVGRLLTKA